MDNNIDVSYTEEILKRYPKDRRFLLAILQDIQRQYNYLPRVCLSMVRDYLGVPLSSLYSMATFYKAFSLKPKGRNIIKVCDGTACHLKLSQNLIDEIKKNLGIGPGETSGDGEYSLETVNCLGSCAVAPVMVVGDDFYGKVAPSAVRDILAGYGRIKDER